MTATASPKTKKTAKKPNDHHLGKKKTPYGNKIINNFLFGYAKDPKQVDKLIFSSEFMVGEQKRLRRFVMLTINFMRQSPIILPNYTVSRSVMVYELVDARRMANEMLR